MQTKNVQNKTMQFNDVKVGDKLPEQAIAITVALISNGALATRDFFPGHHDKDAAIELGSPHIFMNILTTNGLVQAFVERWSGPESVFKNIDIKLGMPNYPGDTMTFMGEVTATDPQNRTVEVGLAGKNQYGMHVTGTVQLVLP
ncbi:MaoC family dehydratase [Cognaticolwellia beringensis]|uniref:Acyl dehydratase n=1 Tax=Cognaticolwellia beringensis TaxID=1967665 RepID=A0A222GDM5_9GAMM|nr:MaoC family dehydratase [Cognaticolwellia beringensis]ASP49985.1 acyl dehydratase [Cognaticolwellia beringensis]